jgi:molybdopterin-guanine dinucleotide biosynthesis protein A
VYILAGGRSSRFGSDKARATIDGEALIQRVARLTEPFARSVTAVAAVADACADLGLRTIADLHPGLGPLGGLYTALSDLDDEWMLLTTCDSVVLRPHWLEMLVASASPAVDAVAFRTERWQPMPAAYSRRCRDVAESRLRSASRSMQGLLDSVNAKALPPPDDWTDAWQVNTPEQLRDFASGGK